MYTVQGQYTVRETDTATVDRIQYIVTSGDVTGAGGKGSNLKIKKILLPPFNPPMHIPCSRRNHNEKPHPLSGPLTKKELLDQNRELTAPMDWVASRPSPHMSRYE